MEKKLKDYINENIDDNLKKFCEENEIYDLNPTNKHNTPKAEKVNNLYKTMEEAKIYVDDILNYSKSSKEFKDIIKEKIKKLDNCLTEIEIVSKNYREEIGQIGKFVKNIKKLIINKKDFKKAYEELDKFSKILDLCYIYLKKEEETINNKENRYNLTYIM